MKKKIPGILVKHFTTEINQSLGTYQILESVLKILFRNNEGISTTRRGAGFSIMLLHLIKNDMADGKVSKFLEDRPLIQHLTQKN